MTKATSISALRELQESGADLTQRQQIQIALAGDAMTRQELSQRTGISINAVCGRVAEMQSAGLVKTGIVRACRITGKQVETLYAVGG